MVTPRIIDSAMRSVNWHPPTEEPELREGSSIVVFLSREEVYKDRLPIRVSFMEVWGWDFRDAYDISNCVCWAYVDDFNNVYKSLMDGVPLYKAKLQQ